MIWLTEDERDWLSTKVEERITKTKIILAREIGSNLKEWHEDDLKWSESLLKKLKEAECIHEPEGS